MPDFIINPIAHTEGADFLRAKPAVTRAIFEALGPELQARCFFITGIESLDVVARVRDLAAQLPEGGDYDELKGRILDELTPWLVKSTDPVEQALERNAAHRRAELLLRMHGWQTYARTQDAMIRANADVFPYCMYIDSGDGRVRPTHHALNGRIIPTNHPFWLNHTPPWEFGCRCDKVGMSQEEVDEIRESEKHLPLDEQRVLGEEQLRRLTEHGQLVKPGGQGFLDIRTPRERNGTGYEWRPQDDALSIDQALERFTGAERKVFEDFAGRQKLDDGRTLLDWWKDGRAPAPANVPPLPGRIPAPVAPRAEPAPAPVVPAKPAAPGPKVKLPKDPVDRTRAKIASADYQSDTPLGGGVNTTVRVKNGVEVVFKPQAGERGNLRPGVPDGTQYLREKAASIIDQQLGTHLVPPTEIITRHGEVGSAQLFSKGAKTAIKAMRDGIELSPETERKMQLLDDVLGHLDRHMGNWMVKRTRGAEFHDLIMIDNGLALSENPVSSGTRMRGPLHGKPLDAVSRAELDAFLGRRAVWEPELLKLIGRAAVDLMLKRIQQLKDRGFGILAKQVFPTST